MATTNIYILELVDGHYYVGKSNDVEKRYDSHVKGNGSVWTKLHAPIKILEVHKDMSPFDEDRITKEYMFKYGIDKVRGGAYVTIDLDANTKDFLQKEMWAANDCCSYCGKKGHFIATCYSKLNSEKKEDKKLTCTRCGRDTHTIDTCEYKTDVNRKKIVDPCPRCGRDTHTIEACEYKLDIDRKKIVDPCKRCGRDTHTVEACEYKLDIDRKKIIDPCKRCGRDYHDEVCTYKTDINRKKIVDMKCERCGRDDHDTSKCKYLTGIDGTPIDIKCDRNDHVVDESQGNNDKLEIIDSCTRCGRKNHIADACEYNTDIHRKKIVDPCTRCGRDNHTVDKCYAKTRSDGTAINDGKDGVTLGQLIDTITSFFNT